MNESQTDARAQIRLLYFLLPFYIILLVSPIIFKPTTPIKEITIIIENHRYLENHRIMHISHYKGRRVSFEGKWIYIPQGSLRENVLLFDRTDPPDPQLEPGSPYTIRYFDTHIWRVLQIKEIK